MRIFTAFAAAGLFLLGASLELLGWANRQDAGWQVLPWALMLGGAYFFAALRWPSLLPGGHRGSAPRKPGAVSDAPSFAVELLTGRVNVMVTGRGYLQLCSLAVTNISGIDLEKRCVVALESITGKKPLENALLPMTMRTDGQIRTSRTGRFSLPAGETKRIPLLLTSSDHPDEWFLFDERGQRHFVPADSLELTVGVFGGGTNCRARIRIDVARPGAAASCSIVECSVTRQQLPEQPISPVAATGP